MDLNKFRNWWKLNHGFFEFTGYLILILTFVWQVVIFFLETKFNFGLFYITKLLVYEVRIPLYIFLLLIVIISIYTRRVRRKFKIILNNSILVGTWKNEWTENGVTREEKIQITDDFKYLFLDGRHLFDVKYITFDHPRKQITFMKIAVQSGDPRKLKNVLSVQNNELLIGTEGDHQIKYTKISSN